MLSGGFGDVWAASEGAGPLRCLAAAQVRQFFGQARRVRRCGPHGQGRAVLNRRLGPLAARRREVTIGFLLLARKAPATASTLTAASVGAFLVRRGEVGI